MKEAVLSPGDTRGALHEWAGYSAGPHHRASAGRNLFKGCIDQLLIVVHLLFMFRGCVNGGTHDSTSRGVGTQDIWQIPGGVPGAGSPGLLLAAHTVQALCTASAASATGNKASIEGLQAPLIESADWTLSGVCV